MDQTTTVPIIFILSSQDIASRGIGRRRSLRVELSSIADDPQQLTVVKPTDPVAGHGSVLASRLAQQLSQRIETRLGDGRLPGTVTAPLGKLIQNTPRFLKSVLAALRDQKHIHAP